MLSSVVRDELRGGKVFNLHSFVSFRTESLWAEKMPGLLIISIFNRMLKTGHVKVRGLEINDADSSFPLVELAAIRIIGVKIPSL